MGNDGGESAAKGALTVEGALELEVRAVPLVLGLCAQRVRLLATHRVVPARELQQPRHLRTDRLRLRKLFEDFVPTTFEQRNGYNDILCGHLLHPQVPLLGHRGPACWTVRQPREAVDADQVTLRQFI